MIEEYLKLKAEQLLYPLILKDPQARIKYILDDIVCPHCFEHNHGKLKLVAYQVKS
jgi:hypothetical protein